MPSSNFKSRDQFTSVDEYSMYVKDNIVIGMSVACCETYEEIRKGDTGKVTKVRKRAHCSTYMYRCICIVPGAH